jgi:F0F1-type ATP synthase membrane subunit b/b'
MKTTRSNPTLTRAADTAPVAWPPLTRAGRDRLRDQAIEQAHALRTQAIAEFWRGTDVWLSQAVSSTRRAADRLAARLRQHAKQRARAAATKS